MYNLDFTSSIINKYLHDKNKTSGGERVIMQNKDFIQCVLEYVCVILVLILLLVMSIKKRHR